MPAMSTCGVSVTQGDNVTGVSSNSGGNGTSGGRVPLSNAERQRRFRQRQREQSAAAAAAQLKPARGYSWPPFEAQNTAAVTHGIHSARMLVPLAEAILAERKADDKWPAYLDEPFYASAVSAWARAEAAVLLYTRYMEQQDPEEWSTELGEAEEEITGDGTKGGDSTRRSRNRKRMPTLEQWRKLEQHASLMRTKLGLDPLARARLGRDVASSQADMAQIMAQLDRDERSAS